MADPTIITAVVMAGAAVVASGTPIIMARRKTAQERDVTDITSWRYLNEALNREITRLREEQDRQRADYQSQLDAARKRISELESEVATLQRALRGP